MEIAQLIRRLDLTILNGVMEDHSDNSWAHFVVEVQFINHAQIKIEEKTVSNISLKDMKEKKILLN